MASNFQKEVEFPYPRPESEIVKPIQTDSAWTFRPSQTNFESKEKGWAMSPPLTVCSPLEMRHSGGGSLLQHRPAVEDCFCLEHGPTPQVSYMRYIRAKDTRHYNQLQAMRSAMASRACSIIDRSCPNEDTTMNAFHKLDYRKRGYKPGCYTPLKPTTVCKAGTPIEPLRIGLANGWRDPELFPLHPKVRHIVDTNHPLAFTRTPVNLKHWFSPYIPGRSEYEDTVSRLGLARMRTTRQYLEPLPSSRLRSGDPNC